MTHKNGKNIRRAELTMKMGFRSRVTSSGRFIHRSPGRARTSGCRHPNAGIATFRGRPTTSLASSVTVPRTVSPAQARAWFDKRGRGRKEGRNMKIFDERKKKSKQTKRSILYCIKQELFNVHCYSKSVVCSMIPKLFTLRREESTELKRN